MSTLATGKSALNGRPHHAAVSVGRVASVLLAVATAWLVFRLPGSVVACFVLPALTIVITGIQRPRRDSVLLWVFLGSAVVASAISTILSPDALPFVNFFSITVVFAIFSIAIVATGLETQTSNAVMTALYWCFGFTLLIGLIEVASGVKLTTFLYPDSSILAIDNRLLVAAYFPNYNDFAVVVTMFALMSLVRFFLKPARYHLQLLRLGAFMAASLLILGQGSRGALLGLIIGSLLVVVQSIRLIRPRLVTPLSVILTALFAALIGALLWASPFIQDNSTAVRGSIVGNTLQLTPDTSWKFWFGWGDNNSFKEAASSAFPWQLMDPHNVILETFTWYGLPTLITLGALWGFVAWRAVWRLDVKPSWGPMSAVVLFSLMPVLGAVPSSSLRYYYIFLLAACSVTAITDRRSP